VSDKMAKVELIYDADCPNVTAARTALEQACGALGLPPEWTEWERSDPKAPGYAARLGSPTVLVDGQDVAGPGGSGDGKCCRVYTGPDGQVLGAPPVESIVEVLRGSQLP